jgi:hypothetical protein
MTPVTNQPRQPATPADTSRTAGRKRQPARHGARRRALRAAAGAETSYLLSLRADNIPDTRS